jgi:hypothetical protein
VQKDDPIVSGHFTALFSILGFSQSAKVQTTTPAEARTIDPAEVASAFRAGLTETTAAPAKVPVPPFD